jgi:hypothetical protein
MTTMLTRISAIAESPSTASLKHAASFLREATNEKDGAVVTMPRLARLISKIPEAQREPLLALVEALSK